MFLNKFGKVRKIVDFSFEEPILIIIYSFGNFDKVPIIQFESQ